ncbi:nickel-dependent hydrogenase large subunit [Lutimonas zeaxanthinifaciens]|uniref:nickel-dependent hydrogenase large subunit n=1 Tax=Lutimonas zeaxanthinifaciens TaxID=3060215 RepID=UPI00265D0B4A|nr:nickel-dependent hydrogenase large subunit [Lutimonas sp. YSD2104]WKK65622.1 nickel-dependent hydrogenase large subunit [Lutimonas sp. YSD2104]
MANRIVVDPVTRIEGHLRIEAEIKDGKIVDAYSSSTMVRGLENIVKGRDPRDVWAFVQRTCGVCTTVHAISSVRAVEDALGIAIPPNAEMVRNIMEGALYMHDHAVHFYHLHALDWVDVVNALSADPAETSKIAQSISNWPKSSPGYFSDIQKRIQKFVDSGQLGIFANGYWGHPQMKLPAAVNLLGVAHYLEALEWQKEIVKVHTILGGKNPHPNYLVGGMACAINENSTGGLNAERLAHVGKLLKEGKDFIEQVYIPDLLAIASFYKDWGGIGKGVGNYLSYGDFPVNGYGDPSNFKFPQGVILNRDLSKVYDVDHRNGDIEEFVNNSWYDNYAEGAEKGRHPWDGETNIKYSGPQPPYEHLDVEQKYSFVKTPRWQGKPMEVGPLSRLLVGYARGNKEIQEAVNGALTHLDVPVEALFSTLGRTAARGIESKLVANWTMEFYNQLLLNIKNGDSRMANTELWDPSKWPAEAKGVGFTEAPRGGLAHWIRIKDGKTENYQQVVPTTWNASPRDPKGQRSAYESALLDTPVADPELPLEIIRTVHSFDPCLACAVHLYDEKGNHISRVTNVGSCDV